MSVRVKLDRLERFGCKQFLHAPGVKEAFRRFMEKQVGFISSPESQLVGIFWRYGSRLKGLDNQAGHFRGTLAANDRISDFIIVAKAGRYGGIYT